MTLNNVYSHHLIENKNLINRYLRGGSKINYSNTVEKTQNIGGVIEGWPNWFSKIVWFLYF